MVGLVLGFLAPPGVTNAMAHLHKVFLLIEGTADGSRRPLAALGPVRYISVLVWESSRGSWRLLAAPGDTGPSLVQRLSICFGPHPDGAVLGGSQSAPDNEYF